MNNFNKARQTMSFNSGWLFCRADSTESDPSRINCDESGFEPVTLPHANTILKKHKGPDFQDEIESYRFVSWYRKHFPRPETGKNGRVFVQFDGAATVADVYVNGSHIGTHKGAYTGFTFDITEKLISGDNVISVKVDSTKHTDIPPEGYEVDYCLFGGIVRGVRLITTGAAYAENTYFTTPGLEESEGKSCRLHSETTVVNTSAEAMSITVETVAFSESSEVIAASDSTEEVNPGESFTFKQDTDTIESPELWDTENPRLYTVITRVLSEGELIDERQEKIGFRWFRFKDGKDDGDASFTLNGKKLKLIGVNRHEQWAYIGRAVPDRLQKKDADLIKDTGFNAVRCSHYPQNPAFLSRCDEIGLIVFEEAPGWQHIGDNNWKEIYKTNVREMILRDRNHPSIVTWGVRVNESGDDDELYTATNEIAHSLDSRPTHGTRTAEMYDLTHFLDSEGVFTTHYKYPDKPRYTPFVITEHSWECWFNGHGCPWADDNDGLDFAYSFANVVNYYFGNPLCAGGFAWCMFDYNNEVNYTHTDNVFYSGVYDIFRNEKMPAHFYRSQKDPKTGANVYIANYMTEKSPKNITVMSNCDEVELIINGKSSGRRKPNTLMNLPHPMTVFDEISFELGEMTAIGYIDGQKAAEHTVRTPENPVRLTLIPEDSTITADGADFTKVNIIAEDKNGTRVRDCNIDVQIECTGSGKFIGEQIFTLEGGQGTFFVKSIADTPGEIRCTAHAVKENLNPGSCTINSVLNDNK